MLHDVLVASWLLWGACGATCMNHGWSGWAAKPSMYCTALSAMKSVEYGAVTQLCLSWPGSLTQNGVLT